MAQKIVTLCDPHQQVHDEDVPGLTWSVAIGPPGGKVTTYEIDLCPQDGKGLQDLLDMVADMGRKVDGPGRPRKAPATPLPDAVTLSEDGRVACPVEGCDKTAKGREALKSHLSKYHDGMSIQEAAGEPLPFACPDCDKRSPNAQGLGAHRRAVHGVAGAASRSAG